MLMAQTLRGLATEKPPETRELVYPRTRGRARPHLTSEGC
jgi:hypothetical protein